MKKILTIAIALVFINSLANADTISSSKGVEKIKSNLNIASANKLEYEKNLQIVNDNLQALKRNKDISITQKKTLAHELNKNEESVKKINSQEKEISQLLQIENNKIKNEEKQLQQLQTLIEQIKKNQTQRQLIITDYQNQLKEVEQKKSEWKERENKLKAQLAENNESLKQLTSDENNWISKKTTYAKEQKKWTDETQRTQKINDRFQGLVEGK